MSVTLLSIALIFGHAASLNILHVVYDDFRTDLPIYGQSFIHAPNFVALAQRGLVFDRAYTQIAVCSPSRNAFMTGRMPHETGTWNFLNHFREATCPPTLGEYLTGTMLATWTETDPQLSGGAGGCCTTCTGDVGGATCVGWSYVNKTCTTFSALVGGPVACPPPAIDPVSKFPFSCMSGGRGAFAAFTTLPQRFREAGFLTLGVGKLFHDGDGGYGVPGDPMHPPGPGTPPLADPPSWSNVSAQYPTNCTWAGSKVECPGLGIPSFLNAYPPNTLQLGSAYLTPAASVCDCASTDTICIPLADPAERAQLENQGCTVDVPLNGLGAVPPLVDVPVQIDAVAKLRQAAALRASTGTPFYLAVGFKKPHLPWRVPKGYINQFYNRASFTPRMPNATVLDASVPPMSWTPWYTASPNVSLSENATLELRRYYYAAVTWADYHLGLVLNELDALGLTNDTAVLVHADHGWHLGEYAMWEKRTLWEAATRVPFVLAVPSAIASHGRRAAAPVELNDVFPTLLALAGVAPPTGDAFPLAGESLLPLLADPDLPVLPNRSLARSTYARCPKPGGPMYDDSCIHTVERTAFPFMGYSIRTAEWRLTAFFPWNGSALAPAVPLVPKSLELYDHRADVPGAGAFEPADFYEDRNVAVAFPNITQALLDTLIVAFGLSL
jgi:arylsulfatase A-like enzyme